MHFGNKKHNFLMKTFGPNVQNRGNAVLQP